MCHVLIIESISHALGVHAHFQWLRKPFFPCFFFLFFLGRVSVHPLYSNILGDMAGLLSPNSKPGGINGVDVSNHCCPLKGNKGFYCSHHPKYITFQICSFVCT
ncbi:unnamed protein product [Prunus armeniaca]